MRKLHRILSLILAAAVMLSSFCVPASAASPKYYIKCMFANINVRSGPGTEYEIVGKAPLGEKYECLGTAFDSGGLTWYKISCNLPEAWISSDYSHRFPYKIKGSAKPAEADTSGSSVNAQVQEVVNEKAKDYGASGIQIAVIRGSDGELFTWNYGYATKNTETMTSDTKLRVASVSKVIVSMCAMKMQEQGIVDTDADISKYWGKKLPKKITLKDLLSHTSTLRYLSFKNTFSKTRKQLTDPNSYLDGEVGSKESWYYNNYAVGVAGSTLEAAADRTLESYANEFLFEPLDVEATFFPGRFDNDISIATLYESDGSVERTVAEARSIMGSEKPGYNTNAFSGGLTVSAQDTAKLFAMLANNGKYDGERILSKKSVKQIEKKLFRTAENGGNFYQCLPLRYVENRYNTSQLYYHTGNAYGAITMASYNPETHDTIVVITVGANPKRDKYGVYEICSSLSKLLYKNMDKLGL